MKFMKMFGLAAALVMSIGASACTRVGNGEAKAITIKASAQADANRILASSISPTLVDYIKANKWNGRVPTVTGSGGTIFSMKE